MARYYTRDAAVLLWLLLKISDGRMLWLCLYQVELLAGGGSMPVTPQNVYEYVRKYAEHRMLVVAEQPLHVSTGLVQT